MDESFVLTPEAILYLSLIKNEVTDCEWDYYKFHEAFKEMEETLEKSGYIKNKKGGDNVEDVKMFVSYTKQGNPKGLSVSYAFGPAWVGQAMAMDDIKFDSEDEAVLYWYHEIFKKGINDERIKSTD